MNSDGRDSALNSHICFNALATLQHIKNVENSCNFCSSSDHSTYMCPVLSQGEHVKDTSTENLSRSSVPHGLQVYENASGTHIISLQKFAKGCRFGPLLAPKSYIPIANTKFPLTIFGTINLDMEAMNMPELKELFKVRHIHLDTRHETRCNWMIHVDPAAYANEQNLVAYEEDNEIFFAAIEDLDVGDILKVWYSPKYGERMKATQLRISSHPIVKNVLQHGEIILSDIQLLNGYATYDPQPNCTEISLPPIKNIIKPSSYVCYDNRIYDGNDCLKLVHGYPAIDSNAASTSVLNNKMLDLDETFSLKTEEHFNEEDLLNDLDDEHLSLNTDGIGQDTSGMSGNAIISANTEKDDKKIYPCKMCDKKYSTMTNIYRHVRTQHNYFLCSLCMNMFKLENDLKEHIHKCPKSDVKKPQCVVCMQYFSNSWSLTRHIKIHVSAGECDADILSDRKTAKDKKIKSDNMKDSIDLSDGDKASRDSLLTDSVTLSSEHSQLTFVQKAPSECDTSNTDPIGIQIEKSESSASSDLCGGDNEISICVVCDKRFKSKPCMNKHLRSVHTVKVLSGSKRPATTNTNSKSLHSQSKRTQSNDSQSTITHTGLPVNPNTAKALASKLNERSHNNNNNSNSKKISNNNFIGLKVAKPSVNSSNDRKMSINELPVPPLVSIQLPQQRINATLDNNQSYTTVATAPNDAKITLAPMHRSNDDFESDISVPAFNIFKKATVGNGVSTDEHNAAMKMYQSDESTTSDEAKLMNPGCPSFSEKAHKCDLCGKKFNKKYELKRHKTVHENVTFTCPYCIKVVKRKPSMIKHLRISHKDFEHIWNQCDFIDTLKQPTEIDLMCASNETNFDGQSMADQTSDSTNNEEMRLNAGEILNCNQIINGIVAVNNKPKKSSAIINYLKKLNYTNVKKYLLKNNNKTTEQFKRNLKLKSKLQLLSIMNSDVVNGKIGQNDNNIVKKDIQLCLENDCSSNNNNNDIVKFDANTPPLSPPSQLNADENIEHALQTTKILLPATSTTTSKMETGFQTSVTSNTSLNFDPNAQELQEVMPNNQLILQGNNVLLSASMDTANKQLPINNGKSVENSENTANNNNNCTDDVQNIIDGCFFVDDTLNVGLNSPFSSDNDVDGFIMSNASENTTMNKELLNKFHDRLEEMEEKIDNADFKLFWNEMSDDDNINDDIEDEVDDEEEEETDIISNANLQSNGAHLMDTVCRNLNESGALNEDNLNALNENDLKSKTQIFNEMPSIRNQINEFV